MTENGKNNNSIGRLNFETIYKPKNNQSTNNTTTTSCKTKQTCNQSITTKLPLIWTNDKNKGNNLSEKSKSSLQKSRQLLRRKGLLGWTKNEICWELSCKIRCSKNRGKNRLRWKKGDPSVSKWFSFRWVRRSLSRWREWGRGKSKGDMMNS